MAEKTIHGDMAPGADRQPAKDVPSLGTSSIATNQGLSHIQTWALARIATGGECVVSRPVWDWLIEVGAVAIVDGVPERRHNVACDLLSGGYADG